MSRANLLCYEIRTNYTFSSTQDESWQPFWRRNSCYREWSKRQTPELICYEIRTRSDAVLQGAGIHSVHTDDSFSPNAISLPRSNCFWSEDRTHHQFVGQARSRTRSPNSNRTGAPRVENGCQVNNTKMNEEEFRFLVSIRKNPFAT